MSTDPSMPEIDVNAMPVGLRQEQLQHLTVVTNRYQMLNCLQRLRGGVTAEVGVLRGVFSNHILSTMKPQHHYMLDMNTADALQAAKLGTTLDCSGGACLDVTATISAEELKRYNDANLITWLEGPSNDKLKELPDGCCDLIYIDASHLGLDPFTDLTLAAQKIKPHGAIVLNDYIYYDWKASVKYTVKHAVHGFLGQHPEWEMIYMGLELGDYNDVVLQKKGSGNEGGCKQK